MESRIKFGTDGWRAIIAEDFTFDNVRACAQGVAEYLKQSGMADRGLLIGYDTRFASEDFAAAAAEVLAGNGIKTYLCEKATPTPVVSYGVLVKKTAGAIIITASHNPGIWSGFKYKNQHGASAPVEVTAPIEASIQGVLTSGQIRRVPLTDALAQGRIEKVDLAPVYREQVGKLVDLPALRNSGLRVVVDSMCGAGAGYIRELLQGGNVQVTEINGERNPLFPGMVRPEPIAINLGLLSRTVTGDKAGVGLATDGDADRMGAIDEKGEFLNQLQVFALLCLYLLETRGERGPLVKTVTSTNMVYRLGEMFGVPVYETTVGFKYVAPIMLEQDALIGGEESGGYGFRGHVAERDGILASLYFLDMMVRTGKTPTRLLEYLYQKVGPHYYERADVEFPAGEREAILSRVRDNPPRSIQGVRVTRVDTADGFRFVLEDNSWLLVRFSGTEPVLRVYAEAGSRERVAGLLDCGRELAGVK